MKFTPTIDKVILDVDLPKEFKNIISPNLDLVVPTKWSLQREQDDTSVIRKGTVIGTPLKREEQVNHPHGVGTEIEIKDGDQVYGHHFFCNEANHLTYNEKKVVHIDYYNLYCKVVKEEIKMLGNWNFLELLYESGKTESGFIIPRARAYDPEIARLVHLNDRAKSMGFKKGDLVRLRDEDRDYRLTVEGKEYIRVLNWDIVGIYAEKSNNRKKQAS